MSAAAFGSMDDPHDDLAVFGSVSAGVGVAAFSIAGVLLALADDEPETATRPVEVGVGPGSVAVRAGF